MKEWFENVCKGIKGVAGYVTLCIVTMLCTAFLTGTTAVASFNKTIDTRIDSRIDAKLLEDTSPVLDNISKKLDYLVSISYDQLLFDIKKQCNKIRNTPDDMKKDDVEYIMARWNNYPEDLKTDYLRAQYEFLKEWYSKQ